MVIGTPSSPLRTVPSCQRRVLSAADCRAPSASRVITALKSGLQRSISARQASSASIGVKRNDIMIDASTQKSGLAVFPVLRYRNLAAAIDWLCAAFGFERYHVTVANNGAIQFAQLTFGEALIMVGPVRTSAFDKLLRQPDEVGGAETQVCYFFVEDAVAHCARSKAAGAGIIFDVKHSSNRGLTYSCRDPEGHLWNFGSYNPWARPTVARASTYHQRLRRAIYSIIVAGLFVTVAMFVMPFGNVGERGQPMPSKPSDIVTGSTTPDNAPHP